jgi:hypothetical protein
MPKDNISKPMFNAWGKKKKNGLIAKRELDNANKSHLGNTFFILLHLVCIPLQKSMACFILLFSKLGNRFRV